jgi:hypothetical protein
LLDALARSVNPLTLGARGCLEDVATTCAGLFLSLRTIRAFPSSAQEV